MKIYYSQFHPVPVEIIDLINNHALSHTFEIDDNIKDIFLIEGKTRRTGAQEIENYLLALVEEVKQGWYCNC